MLIQSTLEHPIAHATFFYLFKKLFFKNILIILNTFKSLDLNFLILITTHNKTGWIGLVGWIPMYLAFNNFCVIHHLL